MELDRIYHGDSKKIIKTIPEASVDCIVTSPPYWNLRDYGVAGQFGNEPRAADYIESLFLFFEDAKRVLKPTGTLWVNIGDVYGSGSGGSNLKNASVQAMAGSVLMPGEGHRKDNGTQKRAATKEFKKCLLQIPARFGLLMTDRGNWILRNRIIWEKPNCMPSSSRDRFTVDYEEILFFTKRKRYYFEQQLEPYTEPLNRWGGPKLKAGVESSKRLEYHDTNHIGNTSALRVGRPIRPNEAGRNKRCVWKIPTRPFKEAHFATYPEDLIEPMIKAGCPQGGVVLDPFMGAGTTAVVAKKLGRKFIGIELNPKYIEIAERRLFNRFGMFR
jgi:site-specific DNA-methyltransferase (adenine-specific)